MEKMSAEQYTDFIDKLADEILDDAMMDKEASEDYGYDDEDVVVERALAAYDAAQMQKEAAENDYDSACAYEDAALQIMDELGMLDD